MLHKCIGCVKNVVGTFDLAIGTTEVDEVFGGELHRYRAER